MKNLRMKQATKFPHLNISKDSLPSVMWLLSRLYDTMGNKLLLECKQKRVGTMVLYKHCDLLSVLSNTLGKPVTAQRHTQTSLDTLTKKHQQEI